MATTTPFRTFAHAKDTRTLARALRFSPPANPFSAIPTAVRSRDAFLSFVTLTALLSEVMLIVLGNVVFRLTLTKTTHTVCI